MVGTEPHLIHAVGQLGLAGVGRRREHPALQVQLPQRAQRVDDQNVRVQIDHPVQLRRQQLTGQQPVVHLLRVLAGERRVLKQSLARGERMQRSQQAAATLQPGRCGAGVSVRWISQTDTVSPGLEACREVSITSSWGR